MTITLPIPRFSAASCIILVLLLLVAGSALTPSAMAESPPRSRPLEPVAFLEGVWEGGGWYLAPDGKRHRFHQRERVELRFEGLVMVVEGEGRLDDADGETIHQALAVLSYDPESRTYQWSAHRGDGKALLTTAEVRDGAFVWGFEAPWGRTRFTIRETSEGEWHEVGELTRDGGETWMKILEMTLQRRATATARQGGVPR
jgi:hypothetical protein